MRPAGRGELDSLYFDYPRFSAPPREQLSGRTDCPVAVVGACPVGMFAALNLARFGVACVLLDKKPTFNDDSRAICLQRSSLQALARAGVAAPFVDKALGWTCGRSFYRGQQILEFEMAAPQSEKYLPMYNMQQQYIEQYLWQAIESDPLIDARWCSELVALQDEGDGLLLRVRDDSGEYEQRAQWLLAADGGRSPVRAMRGLRLRGDNLPGHYVIADVRMAHDYPTIRRALFGSPANPGKTVLIHRQPDDIWRIDYQLGDDVDPAAAVEERAIRAKVGAILADLGHDGPWELEWWSLYTANTLALDDYRDGRVLYIGDSAHVVPIFGVRGLNNGLADAENAAWKLARVVSGQSESRLLDSYSPERRRATLEVFDNAAKSARFMTPPSAGWALMRDAALSLSLSQPWAGEFANPRQMEPVRYPAGGAQLAAEDVDGGVAESLVGAVLPDQRLGPDSYLSELLGPGFNLLALVDELPAEDLQRLRETDPQLVAVGAAQIREHGGEAALARLQAAWGCGPGAALLLRPDGYLAGAWRQLDLRRVDTAMRRAYAREEA